LTEHEPDNHYSAIESIRKSHAQEDKLVLERGKKLCMMSRLVLPVSMSGSMMSRLVTQGIVNLRKMGSELKRTKAVNTPKNRKGG